MKVNALTIIVVGIMLAMLVIGVFVVYRDVVNECTGNTLQYTAKKFERIYPNTEIRGAIYIIPYRNNTAITTILFNSTSLEYIDNLP